MDNHRDQPQFAQPKLDRLHARLPPSVPAWMTRPLRIVPAIVVLNAVVFLAWQVARVSPNLEGFMITNFLASWVHLEHGLVWTLLTSAFSHSEWWHFGVNMVVLWSFGSVLERLIGKRDFLVFYLVSGLVASVAHCSVSLFMGRGGVAALGASGAVSALLLAYSLLFPKHRILIFGIVPVPALVGALAFVALDVWGLVAQGQGGGLPIGHGAHLGGAACGLLFWAFALRGRVSPPQQRPVARPSGLGLSPEEAALFDRLRSKVALEGAASLSPEEMDFLQDIRSRALGDDPREGTRH